MKNACLCFGKSIGAIGLFLVAINLKGSAADPFISTSRYADTYFGGWGVVRVLLHSDLVLRGVIHVDPGSPAPGDKKRIVRGTIVVKELLYGKSDAVPSAIRFNRQTSMSALGISESSATAPFYGWMFDPMDKVDVLVFWRNDEPAWELVKVVPIKGQDGEKIVAELRFLQAKGVRRDNPSALSTPFDASLHPLAEAVRLRLLEEIRENSHY
jgi:hypothetical protein